MDDFTRLSVKRRPLRRNIQARDTCRNIKGNFALH